MRHLIHIEWLKIRKYRAFLLLFGFFVISVFGLNYIVETVVSFRARVPQAEQEVASAVPDMAAMLVGQPFSFPEVWQTVSYLSSFLLFLPGLLIIILMANEFSYRTHRQNVIDGLSRSRFVQAKMGLILILSVVVTLLVFGVGCLFGGGGFSLVGIHYVSYFLIQSLAYMSVALAIVMLFRRSGVSIGLYFLYAFIVENLLSLLVNRYIVSGGGNYLPLESADRLIPAPSILGKVFNPEPVDPTPYLVVSVVWIAVLLWFSLYRFRKMDL